MPQLVLCTNETEDATVTAWKIMPSPTCQTKNSF